MASFECDGNRYDVEFDGPTLAKIQSNLGYDLGDLSAGDWAKIESSDLEFLRVLGEILGKTLADLKAIKGSSLLAARKAVEVAAADFFQPERWSKMQSVLDRKSAIGEAKELNDVLGMVEMYRRLTPEVRRMVKRQVKEQGTSEQLSNLEALEQFVFASGPDATPSRRANDSLESQDATVTD